MWSSIFFALIIFSTIQALKVEKISYSVQKSRLLSNELHTAVFEIDLDRDLVFYKPSFCIPYCHQVPNYYCDYTQKGNNCGTIISQEDLQTQNISCYNENFCSNNNEWQIITSNEPIPNVITDEIGEVSFRFIWDRPCSGIGVRLKTHYGDPAFGISTQIIPTLGQSSNCIRTQPTEIEICPREVGFRIGTWFLSIWSRTARTSKFDIVLTPIDTSGEEPPIVNSTKSLCSNNIFICPQPKVVTRLEYPTISIKIIQITITKCTRFMIQREIVYSPIEGVGGFLFLALDTKPVASGDAYHFLLEMGSQLIWACPSLGQESTNLIFTMTPISFIRTVDVYISYDESEWNLRQQKVTDLGPYQAPEILKGELELYCPNKRFRCEPGSGITGFSCTDMWNVVPRDDKNFLWPIPTFLTNEDVETYGKILYENSSVKLYDDKLIIGVLLEYYSSSRSIISLPDWENILPTCVLKFYPFTRLGSVDGEILKGNYSIPKQRSEGSCELSQFSDLSNQIDQLTASFLDSTSETQILTLRFEIDVLTFSDTWQSCDVFVRSLLTENSVFRKLEPTAVCTIDMLYNETIRDNDPCCNEDVSWYQCCTERSVSTTITDFIISDKHNKCENPDCVSSLLRDYVFYERVITGSQGCGTVSTTSSQMIQKQSIIFYQNCKSQIYGEKDGEGISCRSDKDCQSSYCDLISQKCAMYNLSDISSFDDMFFQCLVDNMPVSFQEALLQAYPQNFTNDISVYDKLIIILNDNFKTELCLDSYGISKLSTHFERNTWDPITCGDPDWFCWDRECEVAPIYELRRKYGRREATCYFQITSIDGGSSDCTSSQVCNWNSNIVVEDQCTQNQSSHFCGFCSSPYSCVEVSNENLSKSECRSLPFSYGCLVGDELIYGLSEDECKQLGLCSSPKCYEENEICTQELCRQNYGYCSFWDVFSHLQPFENVFHWNETMGYCSSPLSPLNFPDCSVITHDGADQRDFPIYSECFRYVTEDSCLKYSSYDYTWKKIPSNEEECLERSSCSEPDVIVSLIRSSKNLTECEKCDGEYLSDFTWTKAEWNEAKWVPLDWYERKMINNTNWGSSVNFDALSTFFIQTASYSTNLQLVTEVQCRLNPIKLVLEQIICTCDYSYDKCDYLSNSNEISVGVGRLCSQTESSLVAPPSLWTFSTTTISEGCVDLVVSSVLSQEFEASSSTSPSRSFREPASSTTNIKNSKGVTVGLFLGNGVTIVFNQYRDDSNSIQSVESRDYDIQELNDVKLCLFFEDTQNINSKYTVLDFGVRVGEEIRPLGSNVTYENSLRCVSGLTVSKTDSTFFPIIRSPTWESDEEESYSDTQIAIYSIMIVLYGIPFLLLTFHELSLGFYKAESRYLNLFLIIALSVRIIYFMYLTIGQPNGEETTGEFIALELPTFAFLSAVSIAAMLWACINRTIEKKVDTKKIVRITIIGNIILYLLLVVVVICFELLDESGSRECFGRVYTDPDTTSQDALRIAYRTIIALITIIVAAVVGYAGGSVVWTLSGLEKGVSRRLVATRKWLFVTIVCSFSTILQCIFFMWYTLYDNPSYEWCLILIPIEIAPISMMFHMITAPTTTTRRSTRSDRSQHDNATIVPHDEPEL